MPSAKLGGTCHSCGWAAECQCQISPSPWHCRIKGQNFCNGALEYAPIHRNRSGALQVSRLCLQPVAQFPSHCLTATGCCSMTLRLAQNPNSNNLGSTVWDSSIVLAKYLEKVRGEGASGLRKLCTVAWSACCARHSMWQQRLAVLGSSLESVLQPSHHVHFADQLHHCKAWRQHATRWAVWHPACQTRRHRSKHELLAGKGPAVTG